MTAMEMIANPPHRTQDMDLIDILWRQDMDLGVGREMFDLNLRRELEKEKELEKLKEVAAEKSPGDEYKNEDGPGDQQQSAVQYVKDDETGELVPAPVGYAPSVSPQQPNFQQGNLEPELDQTNEISVEEAMRLLEAAHPLVVNTIDNLSSQLNANNINNMNNNLHQPGSSAITPELNVDEVENTIEAMINSAQQVPYQPVPYARQDSFDRCWQEVASMLNLEESQSTDTPNITMDVGLTNVTHLDSNSSPLLHNASLAVPVDNLNNSFSQNMDLELPSAEPVPMDFISAAPQPPSLLLNSTSNPVLPTSGSYPLPQDHVLFPNVTDNLPPANTFNQTADSLLQELFDDDIDFGVDMGADNIGFDEMQPVCKMDNASSDSAVGSLPASPMQEMDSLSVSSNQSSPYDGLEGATGGFDCGSPDGKYTEKYQPYQYADYHGNHESSMHFSNHSASSNESDSGYSPADMRHVKHNHTYPLQPGQQPREYRKNDKKKKSPMSRDERKAKALKIPFSLDEIIESPVERFTEMLQKHSLSESQLQMIRDIRRRGKNKLAAQNCRKRKIEVISFLDDDVEKMRADKQRLIRERHLINKEIVEFREKIDEMYKTVFSSLRDDSGNPYDPSQFSLQHTADGDVFLVPSNGTARAEQPQQHEEKRTRKRKSKKRN